MLKPRLTSGYIALRRAIRQFVVQRPSIDRRLGKALVRFDLLLRKTGLLRSVAEAGQIEFRGLTLHYRPDQAGIATSITTNGGYEPETLSVIEEALLPGHGFVDLGAHIGFFTLAGAQAVGESGRVYAFEPTPATRASLVENVRTNGFESVVRIEPCAVSDACGKARLLITEHSVGNSLATDAAEASGPSTIEVEVVSMDAYFRGLGWPRVDLIKMDIEGQELNALRGMQELIARNPSIRLIFEYHRRQMDRAGVDRGELFAVLRDMGFTKFSALFREPQQLDLPAELPRLAELSHRANLNILAERG